MAPKSKSKKAVTPSSQSDERATAKPNWPAFTALPPTIDLSVESLVPGQIALIRNLWTSSLCRTFVAFLSSLPLVTTPGKPKKGEAVRVNDRYQVDDAHFARRLWAETGLEKLLSQGADINDRVEHENTAESDVDSQNSVWGGEVVSQVQTGPAVLRP